MAKQESKDLGLHLYRPFERKPQSFKNSKVHTIPSQSMSLKEILQRFVRRESLPVAKEGVYSTRFGDLEKLSREDISVQMDRVNEIKENISKADKRMKENEQKRVQAEIERKAAEQAAANLADKAKADSAPAV